MEETEIEPEVRAAYCALYGREYWTPEHCKDAYEGCFDTAECASGYVLDQWYEAWDVTGHIACYIDDDRVLRDLFIEAYNIVESDGQWYLFRIC